MKELEIIRNLKVSSVEGGVGSFIYINFDDENSIRYKLWIYDTRWAFTVDDKEFISSDDVSLSRIPEICQNLVGRIFIGVEFVDQLELHLKFDGEVFLEVWVDEISNHSLGAIIVYKNDNFLNKISFPVSSGGE